MKKRDDPYSDAGYDKALKNMSLDTKQSLLEFCDWLNGLPEEKQFEIHRPSAAMAFCVGWARAKKPHLPLPAAD